VTRLRNMMLEELQRRNYSESTTRAYVRVVRELAAYFRQPPDRLGPEHLRQFQAHLFRERKLNARTVVQYSAGLRFFFVKTLKRHDLLESIPLPKEPRKLPTVLSQGEVTKLIESASSLIVHTKNQIRAKESNLSASCEKRWNRIARATDLTRAKGRLRGQYFQDLGFPIEDVKRPGVRNGDANRQARGTLPPSLRSNPAFAAIPARLCRAIDECANCGSSERRL
jgi:hypothetical protein